MTSLTRGLALFCPLFFPSQTPQPPCRAHPKCHLTIPVYLYSTPRLLSSSNSLDDRRGRSQLIQRQTDDPFFRFGNDKKTIKRKLYLLEFFPFRNFQFCKYEIPFFFSMLHYVLLTVLHMCMGRFGL